MVIKNGYTGRVTGKGDENNHMTQPSTSETEEKREYRHIRTTENLPTHTTGNRGHQSKCKKQQSKQTQETTEDEQWSMPQRTQLQIRGQMLLVKTRPRTDHPQIARPVSPDTVWPPHTQREYRGALTSKSIRTEKRRHTQQDTRGTF